MNLDFLDGVGIDYSKNPYKIKKAIYDKVSTRLVVDVEFEEMLSLNCYLNFKHAFDLKAKEINIFYKLNINYVKHIYDSSLLDDYLGYILKDLTREKTRYSCFNDAKRRFSDNEYIFSFAYDSKGIGELAFDIEERFKDFGLNIAVSIELDQNISVEAEMRELDLKQRSILNEMKEEKQNIIDRNTKLEQTRHIKDANYNQLVPIKNIPTTSNDLQIYSINEGMPFFNIEGYIFAKEVKTFPSKSTLATLKITDDTDSIVVKKWLREGEKEIFEKIKINEIIRAYGKAEYDPFSKSVVLLANKITIEGIRKEEFIIDEAKVKRVELHAHSKMSSLDGLVAPSDYVNVASKWGHRAIAITDHNGVYNIPLFHNAIKGTDILPIYGTELNYIDDSKYFITFNEQDIDLTNINFVVFDLETTGFSQERDRIIEIAATKCNITGEIETFESFVNPCFPIPSNITEITSITDDMVSNAPTIEEILPKFLEFSKGSILVAHNASFDIGMIKANMKRLGIDMIDFPVIDTLNGFRALHFNDVKRFNLKELAKFYKVKQEHHHRAIDDTRVTALCFLKMLQEFISKGINNYKDINSLINPNIFYKAVIPKHINILVKNQKGLKNLYKLLSDALTVHCYNEARLLKSVLNEYRDGIIVSSGCVNGEVFQEALNGNYDNLLDLIDFYDFIEVQPPKAYGHLFNEITDGEEVIKDTIKLIIKAAKEKNKLVCATSDCHYLYKEDKSYRDILINSPQIGGIPHPLSRYKTYPNMHLRTTNQMLEEFNFLDEELSYEIVVTNTNLIADMIDNVEAFPKQMFAPRDDEFKNSLGVDSIVETTRKIVNDNLTKLYGENPHQIVKNRVKRELDSIISNGYASVYYMSHLLVTMSLKDGYLVGSRGSVGSSFVATMMQITEINPLQPHYLCPKCKFQTFKMNEEEKEMYGMTDNDKLFSDILQSVESGYDLPDAVCPICGEKLRKDGHDIPFETFLGFNGDKIPDIDLNFSGEYQSIAHEFVRKFMGQEHAFRGGTIGKIKSETAYGYVKGYCERKNISLRSCEIERLGTKLDDVRRTTGQHPGGIIVVPEDIEIYDITPIQYPADSIDNAWRTTHYDYHSFESNLLKLDILGHDDPTIIKYLMDYVHEHQEEFPFDNPQDIPIDDKNVYRLFSGTDVLNITKEDIDSDVASFAVPEFGTNFVRNLLQDTRPKTFSELVKISGLSHGTGIWQGNAQELVLGKKDEFGKIPFSDVIGCRDDIMVYLLYQNLEALKAFEIMEFVRKGKVKKDPDKWTKYKEYMIEKKVPSWYIWSCEQIQYMFPKAHATAYVLMALRIAWFKVYSPKLFYSAYFSTRAKAHSVKAYTGGKLMINSLISELSSKPGKTAKDDDLISSLMVAREMVSRKIKFLPVDIFKSDSHTFIVEEDGIRIPFSAVDGLGDQAADDLVEKRKEKLFTSKQDVLKRTKLNNTLYQEFERLGIFLDLPEKDKEEELGLFGLTI